MKKIRLLLKIFSSVLIVFGLSSCKNDIPDCQTCTLGEETDITCEANGWDTDYGSSWEDYVNYWRDYYSNIGGSCD